MEVISHPKFKLPDSETIIREPNIADFKPNEIEIKFFAFIERFQGRLKLIIV